MANNDIEFDLKLDNSQFNRAVAQATSGVDRITKSITPAKATFIGLGSVIGGQAVLGAVKGLANAVSSAVSSMVSNAKRIETIRSQFTTLTGSVANANVLLKDLQKFAASTPFQLPGLADASKKLLGFGFAQSEVIGELQKLGDVAAASGADINELTLIYGQVAAAGKLTGERLLQLQERAIPIGPAIAKTMGVAESAVKDLVSQGKVTTEVFQKAFATISAEGGIAFEGMARQSLTLDGILSTLSDNFDQLTADIGAVFVPILKKAATAAISFIQSIDVDALQKFIISGINVMIKGINTLLPPLNRLSQFFIEVAIRTNDLRIVFLKIVDSIALFLQPAFTAVGDVLNSLGKLFVKVTGSANSFIEEGLRKLSIQLGDAQGPLAGLIATSESYGEGLQTLQKFLRDNEDAQFDLLTVEEKRIESMKSVASATKKAASETQTLVKVSKEQQKVFQQNPLAGNVGGLQVSDLQLPKLEIPAAGPVVETSDAKKARELEKQKAQDFSNSLQSGAKEFTSALGSSISKGGKEGAKELTKGVAVAVGTALGGPAVGQIVGPIADILLQGGDQIKENINSMVEMLPTVIDTFVDAIPVLIETLANKSDEIIIALVNASPRIVVALAKSMPIVARELVIALGNLLRAFATQFSNEIGKVISNITKAGPQFTNSIISGAKTFISTLIERLKEGFRQVGNIFSTIANAFIDPMNRLIERVKSALSGGSAGKKVSSGFQKLGKSLGFATGGAIVQGTGNRDTVPALLTPGEVVVDRTTGPKLMRFLDLVDSSSNTGQPTDTSNSEILVKILEAVQKPMQVTATTEVDGEAFANIILNLNRQNARLA